MLGWLGVSGSEKVAATLNILIGLSAFILSRYTADIPQDGQDAPEAELSAEDGKGYANEVLKVVLAVFGISGMLALAYEVLWAHILVFLLGSSIYSFSMILVVYLTGLTVGSLILSRFADKLIRPIKVFGWIEILIGISALAGLLLFRKLPFERYSLESTALYYLHTNFLCTAAIMLLPTLLMGATFPLAVRIYTRSLSSIGRRTGTLYAVNTIGAIAGSFLAGFVLIPLLGSKNSMVLLALLSIATGFSLLYMSMKHEGATRLNWLAGVLVVLPVLGFSFGSDLMEELSLGASSGFPNTKIVAFDEDATAAVAVIEGRGAKPVFEGKPETEEKFHLLVTNGVLMTVQCTETQLMAHLPLALVKNPDNVLNICFGMGTTFVSARKAGMDVDFVELCPFVVESFRYFQEGSTMLDEPGAGKIIADGRNYLLLSDKAYDLITIDPPPPPWSAGTVNLCTKEFYELCKARLSSDGIVCQWLPIPAHSPVYTEEQYKMLLRTFVEVFPHTTVWGSPSNMGTYLIATPEPLRIDKEAFRAYFDNPAVRDDLSLYMTEAMDGPQVLSLLILNEYEVRKYVDGSVVMTDDLPLIEFPLFRVDSSEGRMRMGLIYEFKGRKAGGSRR